MGELGHAGSTYAIGDLFKSHFSAGGTLDTFNPEKAREMYEKYVEKGKATAAWMWGDSGVVPEDVPEALEKLVALRDAGDLTREEYDELKRTLIAQIACAPLS